jgi:hypothetical protein
MVDIEEEEKTTDSAPPPDQFEWVTIVTSSRNCHARVTRSSARHRLVVVSGAVMMTALIRAREVLGPPPDTPLDPSQLLEDDPVVVNTDTLPYCHSIVQAAVQLFLPPSMPRNWCIESSIDKDVTAVPAARHSPSPEIKYQIILEDFASPVSTHATSGRLATVLSKLESDDILRGSDGCDLHLDESRTVTLKKNGEKLSFRACKDVSVLLPKLLPMLVLHLNTECDDCTVIQTKNRKESLNWIETYCKALHEEALLF